MIKINDAILGHCILLLFAAYVPLTHLTPMKFPIHMNWTSSFSFLWLLFCNCSMFCCALLYVHSSFAIILIGKRELVALLSCSSWCLVIVVWLFLAVSWDCLQFVIVVFPDHTHLQIVLGSICIFYSNFNIYLFIYLYLKRTAHLAINASLPCVPLKHIYFIHMSSINERIKHWHHLVILIQCTHRRKS